ncbi:MAG: hypothetical protein K9L74_06440 [Candidatus Izimaplasma sp.]|nr:hypothetical protein [Candidatus Izimaplasma bacterium]
MKNKRFIISMLIVLAFILRYTSGFILLNIYDGLDNATNQTIQNYIRWNSFTTFLFLSVFYIIVMFMKKERPLVLFSGVSIITFFAFSQFEASRFQSTLTASDVQFYSIISLVGGAALLIIALSQFLSYTYSFLIKVSFLIFAINTMIFHTSLNVILRNTLIQIISPLRTTTNFYFIYSIVSLIVYGIIVILQILVINDLYFIERNDPRKTLGNYEN